MCVEKLSKKLYEAAIAYLPYFDKPWNLPQLWLRFPRDYHTPLDLYLLETCSSILN